MDFLDEAKRLLADAKHKPATGKPYWGIEQVDVARTYALIALAEEHRKANELHSLFEEYMNKDE